MVALVVTLGKALGSGDIPKTQNSGSKLVGVNNC